MTCSQTKAEWNQGKATERTKQGTMLSVHFGPFCCGVLASDASPIHPTCRFVLAATAAANASNECIWIAAIAGPAPSAATFTWPPKHYQQIKWFKLKMKKDEVKQIWLCVHSVPNPLFNSTKTGAWDLEPWKLGNYTSGLTSNIYKIN